MRYAGVICLAVAALATAAGPGDDAELLRRNGSFHLTTHGRLFNRTHGRRMLNIMYLDWDEEVRKLTEGRKDNPHLPDDYGAFICYGNRQRAGAKAFAGHVGLITYWAFVFVDPTGPGPDDLVWPHTDHGYLNHLRTMRKNAGQTPLVPQLHVGGDPQRFAGRGATTEELEWMVLAAAGADVDGLVWRGRGAEDANIDNPRVRRLVELLDHHGDVLGPARPVRWVQPPEGQPCSALLGDGSLFVFLLDGDYMHLDDEHRVALPARKRFREGELVLTPPAGLRITGGRDRMGGSVELRHEAGRTLSGYAFRGGGELLTLDVKGTDSREEMEHQP